MLHSARTDVVSCPYLDGWLEGNGLSAQEQAENYVPTTRTWSHSTFFSGMAAVGKRSVAEQEEIMDQFWASYIAEAAANPDQHGMDYVHSYLAIEKQ